MAVTLAPSKLRLLGKAGGSFEGSTAHSLKSIRAVESALKSIRTVEIAGEMITHQPNPDRRLVTRTSISSGGGLLFFNSRQGVRGVRVIDISHRGVRLRTHRRAILPIEFKVTWDNFATVQSCRLVWRWGELIGAAFEAWSEYQRALWVSDAASKVSNS